MKRIVYCFLLVFISSSVSIAQSISSQQAIEDLDCMMDQLKESHVNLFLHQSEDSLNAKLNHVKNNYKHKESI